MVPGKSLSDLLRMRGFTRPQFLDPEGWGGLVDMRDVFGDEKVAGLMREMDFPRSLLSYHFSTLAPFVLRDIGRIEQVPGTPRYRFNLAVLNAVLGYETR